MELKEVRYLLSLYRCGSVTGAAKELYITQPALTKFLKKVEGQLGAPLFSRVGGELIPTHVGERYLSYILRMADLKSEWEAECADLLDRGKGHLSIAVPLVRGSCIIPDTLPRFYRRYPQVQITLMEESHSVEKHLLSTRSIDLVIYNDTSPQPSLVHEELGKEEVVLVMSREHALATRGVERPGCRYPWLDLALLRGEPLVLHPPEQTTGRIAAQLLEINGVEPNLLLRTRNSDMAIRLAATGAAMAFAPESYVQKIHFEQPPRCFSIGAPKTETTLYAIRQKGRYLPSYGEYFLRLVREYMQSYHGQPPAHFLR